MKKYKCGLYVGRFQPLHVGHTNIIDKMFDECEVVIVAVGSAQESGTQRNPFDFAMRSQWIVETFCTRTNHILHVVPIPDREHPSNDASWGDYLLDQVLMATQMTPDVIYEGEEEERAHWYDNLDVSVVKVPRTVLPISGTMLRNAIMWNDKDVAFQCLPYAIRGYYDEMRKEILKCRS